MDWLLYDEIFVNQLYGCPDWNEIQRILLQQLSNTRNDNTNYNTIRNTTNNNNNNNNNNSTTNIRNNIEYDDVGFQSRIVQMTDGCDRNLMHYAYLKHASLDIIQFLYGLCPDLVHPTDSSGQCILHHLFAKDCCFDDNPNDDEDILTGFLPSHSSTSCRLASVSSYLYDVIRFTIQVCSPTILECRDMNGCTPLHLACYCRSDICINSIPKESLSLLLSSTLTFFDWLRLLVENNPESLQIRNDQNKTALCIASGPKGNRMVEKWIRQYLSHQKSIKRYKYLLTHWALME